MKQKIIRVVTVFTFLFLLFCTAASVQVQKLLFPQVTVAQIVPGTVMTEGEEISFEYTVPVSAIQNGDEGDTIFYLQKIDGRFGKEYQVLQFGINVLARDEKLAAVGGKGYGDVVVSSTKQLENGMKVLLKR